MLALRSPSAPLSPSALSLDYLEREEKGMESESDAMRLRHQLLRCLKDRLPTPSQGPSGGRRMGLTNWRMLSISLPLRYSPSRSLSLAYMRRLVASLFSGLGILAISDSDRAKSELKRRES